MKRVLVVDDEPVNIRILASILRDDYEIESANSGEEALEMVRQDPPDAVLLDVMMPGMTGIEVCMKLRADPTYRRIPIIFVSSLDDFHNEEVGFEAGASDYLFKPVHPPSVIARLRVHLESTDYIRSLESRVEMKEALKA